MANLEEMAKETGRTEEILKDMYNEASNFGSHYVFWKEFSTWYAIRVNWDLPVKEVMDEMANHHRSPLGEITKRFDA